MSLLPPLVAFLGAALLFTAQPAAAKAILPWLGGGPVAWGATLLFFQVTLLLGYAAVDATLSRLGIRWLGVVHVGLLLVGAASLAIARPFAVAPEAGAVTLGLALRLLVGQLGLAVLALTLTAPAVQAHFAAGRAADDRSAYRLYAASNAGSLLGLLAYPWLIEPRLGIAAQWVAWRAGVILLAALCGLLWWPRGGATASPPDVAQADRPTAARWLEWAIRAAIPAAFLASVTEYLTRDLAPVPLLWALPLGLYLATWIAAFSPVGATLVRFARDVQDVVAVAAIVILLNQPYALIGPAGALMALAVVGLAQHGVLASAAPPTAWLGRFYVLLALGGAAGTALVVAAGPTFLPLPIEAPIALAAAVALGAPARRLWTPAGLLRFAVFGLVATAIPLIPGVTRPAVLASASIGAGVLAMRWRGNPRIAALVLAVLVAVDVAVRLTDPARIGANHSVLGRFVVARSVTSTRLISGSTLHGLEPVGIPGERPQAALYYTRNGPFGDVVRAVEASGPDRRIGVVGLGIGSLACTASPGTALTFFELNPGVVRLARDTTLFQTLTACAPDAAVHLGDARLTLAQVEGQYHLLGPRRLQFRRHPDPPADAGGVRALSEPGGGGGVGRVPRLEPVPRPRSGAERHRAGGGLGGGAQPFRETAGSASARAGTERGQRGRDGGGQLGPGRAGAVRLLAMDRGERRALDRRLDAAGVGVADHPGEPAGTVRSGRSLSGQRSWKHIAACPSPPTGVTMTAAAGLNATTLGCSLTCREIETSIRFYRDVLGFGVEMTFEREGKLAGAVVRAGDIRIVLNQDDGKLGWDRVKGQGFYLQINVAGASDVDAAAARITAAGGTLIDEPADRYWGARMFQFRDPDGFKLGVSTPLAG